MFTLNSRFLLHEKIPMLNGYGHAVVLSGSMEPELSVDDMVIIHRENQYKENDIVTYVDDRSFLVTHRVVSIEDEMVTARGDANNVDDTPFHISRVKGKVVSVVKGVGKLISFIQNPFFVIAVVVVTILLMHFSYRSADNKKDKRIAEIQKEIDRLKAERESAKAMQSDEHTDEQSDDSVEADISPSDDDTVGDESKASPTPPQKQK